MRSKLVLVLVAAVALTAGVASAEDMAGSGVTFMNETQRPITLTAKKTADDNCLKAADLEKIAVDAGQSSTVDSGSSNVCYCLDLVRRNSCTSTWAFAKAGSKVRLR